MAHIELPIPSRDAAERAVHAEYQTVLATLSDKQRDPIVRFVNYLLDGVEAQYESLQRLQLRSDDPVSVEAIDEGDGIWRLDLRNFATRLPAQFDAVLAGVLDRHPTGLIVDVRDSLGGRATACEAVLGNFLPAGTLVARFIATVESEGVKTRDLVTTGDPTVGDLPIIVLVNKWSASTAEIFAAALQSHGRALLVGTPTFGTPQAHATSVSGETMTLGVYARPDGSRYDPDGVQPDVPAADAEAVDVAIARLTDASR